MRDFKHFLEFADRGARALAEAFAPTGGDVESPFEAAVLAGLQAKGWRVHTQIGVSGFRVDLGIVHPDAPGRYLAGVECDGATYHSSATARDRDRLREHVLTDLGWRIRRVWSTEWWMDAQAALAKLDRRLREDLDEDRTRSAASAVAAEPEGPVPSGDAPEPASADRVGEPANDPQPARASAPPRLYADRAGPSTAPAVPVAPPAARIYRIADFADLGLPIEPERFYDAAYRPTLAAMVAHVLAVEAPLYEDVLIRRIARAHGLNRVGPLIRAAVSDQVDASVARSDDDDRVVLWPSGQEPRASVPYRSADASVRTHLDTPMAELVGLAGTLRSDASEAERVKAMGQTLGLFRIEAAARARFERASLAARTET